MSEDIKELVKRLDENWGRRRIGDMSCLLADAADALEAMAGEVERLTAQNIAWADKYGDTQNAMYAALDERDRLSSEVAKWKQQYFTASAQAIREAEKAEAAESERDRLKAAITTHVAGCVACGGSGAVFLCPELDNTAEAVREDCEECVGLRKALGGDAS